MVDMDTMIDALNSPVVPMNSAQRKEQEMQKRKEELSSKSNTEILLAIFEKVVCIEEKMEHPSQPPLTLPTSNILEGEFS